MAELKPYISPSFFMHSSHGPPAALNIPMQTQAQAEGFQGPLKCFTGSFHSVLCVTLCRLPAPSHAVPTYHCWVEQQGEGRISSGWEAKASFPNETNKPAKLPAQTHLERFKNTPVNFLPSVNANTVPVGATLAGVSGRDGGGEGAQAKS